MSALKDIPQLARDHGNLSAVIEAVREVLQTFRGYRGNALDKALTLRGAIDTGILLDNGTFAGSAVPGPIGPAGPAGPSGATYTPDLTAPPTPTGLAVTAGLTSIFIQCATPVYTQGHGHDRTVVYGAQWPGGAAPTFSAAVELFEFQGTFGAYPTETDTRWCIWIKWLSLDAVLSASPAGGTNGVQATTALVNSSDLAVGTIAAGTAFITDAKIADLSAGKLTVGDGTVGGNLKSSNYVAGTSGWLLTPAGYLEAQNAVLRGTVYASAGLIGGITIASDAIRAGQTAYNTGSGFWIGANGNLSVGNSAGNHLTWNGTNLVVVGGGTFSGTLSAATGTFAGSLSAATGSFAGSLSAATGTFAGSLSAATGSFAGALSAATGSFSGVLTTGAINAVSTINIADNAVSVMNSASGAGTCSTTLNVPANQTMRIVGIGYFEKYYLANSGSIVNGTPVVTIDGVAASNSIYGTTQGVGLDGSAYVTSGAVFINYLDCAGGASGRTVTISLSGNYNNAGTNKIIAMGFMR